MSKFLKISLLTLLILLVVLAAIAETPILEPLLAGVTLARYLRLVAILGLATAFFFAWGYKRKMEASQKYLRAKEILAEAEAEAKRKKRAAILVEEKLKSVYQQKESALTDELSRARDEYQQRIAALKRQNMQLKESVAKLLRAVKQKRANADSLK